MKRTFSLLLSIVPMVLFAQVSPYINKVYDYYPAPGQFVNVMPSAEPGDTKEQVLQRVEDAIVGKANGSLVSLGAWGGYIVVGFDHGVQNVSGEYDLKIYGNAMSNASEPGVVMVAEDVNENGFPDDPWYELKGSAHELPQTKHNYKVTYYRPAIDHLPQPHPTQNLLTDTHYIRWADSEGNQGYLEKNATHSQDYYPLWQQVDSLTFVGTRLPDNAIDQNGDGTFFAVYPYDWGYADNQPNGKETSCLNLDWAVDEEGNPVELTSIHFVKVYTGVLQSIGWTGESSTEIAGMVDLHALASSLQKNSQNTPIIYKEGVLTISLEGSALLRVYDILGKAIFEHTLTGPTQHLTLPESLKGVFVCQVLTPQRTLFMQKLLITEHP